MVSMMAIAVMLSASGNIINAFGYIIQKKAHVANSKLAEDERKPFCCNGLWLGGFCVYGLGSAMHTAGLTFGPQSVLAAMDSLTLAANALLAPVFLDEKLHRRDVMATAAIIMGASVVVVFGPHANQEFDAKGIFSLFVRTPFVAYIVSVGAVLVGTYVGSKLIERQHRERGIEMDGNMTSWRMRYLATAYSILGGFFASMNELMAKSVGETFDAHFSSGEDQFDSAEAYLLVLIFICTNILLEYWKQKALALFGALYVIPIFQVSLVAFASVSGAVFFDEFKNLPGWSIGLFFVGISIICFSIFALTSYQPPPDEIIAVHSNIISSMLDIPDRDGNEEADLASPRKKRRRSVDQEGEFLIRRDRTSSLTKEEYLRHVAAEGSDVPHLQQQLLPGRMMVTPSRVPILPPLMINTAPEGRLSHADTSSNSLRSPTQENKLGFEMEQPAGPSADITLLRAGSGACPNLVTDWQVGHRGGLCEDCGMPRAEHARAIPLARVDTEGAINIRGSFSSPQKALFVESHSRAALIPAASPKNQQLFVRKRTHEEHERQGAIEEGEEEIAPEKEKVVEKEAAVAAVVAEKEEEDEDENKGEGENTLSIDATMVAPVHTREEEEKEEKEEEESKHSLLPPPEKPTVNNYGFFPPSIGPSPGGSDQEDAESREISIVSLAPADFMSTPSLRSGNNLLPRRL